MSNSSPAFKKFGISALTLSGEGAWPSLSVENISPQLNIFYAPPRAGKSSVAQLAGHLLYGKSESQWRRQFGQTVSNAAGSIRLDRSNQSFVLRRHYDASKQSRLTISSGQGDAVDAKAIQDLLAGISPQLAAKIFHVDFAESPRADWLLSKTFAREFSTSRAESNQHTCCSPAKISSIDRVDRQRIDELVKRRDAIAGEIQQQMAVRRNESETLEREINHTDSTLTSHRKRLANLQSQLHTLEIERAGLESRLRYLSLRRDSRQRLRPSKANTAPFDTTTIDNEIADCRQTLVDLKQRQTNLRTEIAQCAADGTADSVTCLADSRATLGTLEILLNDLDTEVSQLARAHEPGRCIGHDAHTKISPVASLLRQQVYALCGQLTEQERIARRQQLTAELRQLTRVHSELSERLELLLTNRESLVQQLQRASQPIRLDPQPPAADHCHCENHHEFIHSTKATALSQPDQGLQETELRDKLAKLRHTYTLLSENKEALQQDIQQLEQQWKNLQRERANLIGHASIEQQKAELERIELVLRETLHTTASDSPLPLASSWRASDILAQLTNGQLVQIRLERDRSQATIIDHKGHARTIAGLTACEHDQLNLALTLSLVSSYAQRGIHLPLILDEPFLQQSSATAAIMAGVLNEFARAGHQLLVFTEQRGVCDRLETLHAAIFDLENLREQTPIPSTVTPAKPHTTNTRIIRKTFDSNHKPELRIAIIDGDPQQDEIFYLSEESSFNDFPVLGADTGLIFNQINIHSIGDLLAADANQVAQLLNRKEITTETIRLWQSHMGLMCFIPHLTLDDAQILAANNIYSPANLFDADLDALQHSINEFLNSARGSRFTAARNRYDRSRLSDWRLGARRYRDRWLSASHRFSSWQTRSSGSPASGSPASGSPASGSQSGSTKRNSKKASQPKRKFYLSREQDVEAAPSIGPKTAKRLAKVGIRTVADLLNADSESTASELDVSHINATTLSNWQHQARLACQIPGLRGYGAQLLVACGMTQPEHITRTHPDKLIAEVLSLCETKEGQQILRAGDAPSPEKVADWINLAAHSRPLEAA